jgi:hypothetical protein
MRSLVDGVPIETEVNIGRSVFGYPACCLPEQAPEARRRAFSIRLYRVAAPAEAGALDTAFLPLRSIPMAARGSGGRRRMARRPTCRPPYSGQAPPGNGMIDTSLPAGRAGACGLRTTRQSEAASGRIIELSCTSNGTASTTPSAARTRRARR